MDALHIALQPRDRNECSVCISTYHHICHCHLSLQSYSIPLIAATKRKRVEIKRKKSPHCSPQAMRVNIHLIILRSYLSLSLSLWHRVRRKERSFSSGGIKGKTTANPSLLWRREVDQRLLEWIDKKTALNQALQFPREGRRCHQAGRKS